MTEEATGPDAVSFEVQLFLRPQKESTRTACALPCMFCSRSSVTMWMTSYSTDDFARAAGVCETCRSGLVPLGATERTRSLHVDDFIDDPFKDPYARFMLNYFRSSATNLHHFAPFMKGRKLFCTWKGSRWRVTGASRLGDVWLRLNHGNDVGYDERVEVSDCSDWSANP